MARELGDLVRTWITHNEPWVVTFPGHAQGRFAPGVRDWPTALAVSHHLLLSHGLARPALPGSVGITLNLSPVHAAGPGEEEAARLYDGHLNRWFLDPVLRGAYPEDVLALLRAPRGPDRGDPRGRPRGHLAADRLPGRQLLLPLARARGPARRAAGRGLRRRAAAADRDGVGGRAGGPLRAARPPASRLRDPDGDHRERRRLRRPAGRQRHRRGPRPRRLPRGPSRRRPRARSRPASTCGATSPGR